MVYKQKNKQIIPHNSSPGQAFPFAKLFLILNLKRFYFYKDQVAISYSTRLILHLPHTSELRKINKVQKNKHGPCILNNSPMD